MSACWSVAWADMVFGYRYVNVRNISGQVVTPSVLSRPVTCTHTWNHSYVLCQKIIPVINLISVTVVFVCVTDTTCLALQNCGIWMRVCGAICSYKGSCFLKIVLSPFLFSCLSLSSHVFPLVL